ncbi:hypothetical protein Btru_023840 [Bulinus truncatus]|nr:hypothetical protein Btru_023840 [Bulinus truncatus]
MCKNITLGNCKDFDQTFFFCDSVYLPNITNTRFRLTIRPEPEYSMQFLRINFEYSHQCRMYKDVVFQLPQIFGSPVAYMVFNNKLDIVLEMSRNCSVLVQPGELNKFSLCVRNMLNPTLNVTIQHVLSIIAHEGCVQAVATFSIRQLPSTMHFRAFDQCEEDVAYYCQIQLEPSIKLYVNKVEVYITKRSNTCSFFVKNLQWNTVNICVGHFMSYNLGIRYETRFLQLAPESFTCVTIEFIPRSTSQNFDVKVRDSTNAYLTTFTCRYYKI